ncbi:major capsid protein [Cyprinid herpesvirus 3]|uniref:Major capsid protein n=1 Tax=Cyprinid herpesvirus 3 TaxID=180230 RepID=Q52UN8_CYHV3|nr:major capsid protein [Cyprinid herpesvirus 3]AIC32447.1 ORF92R [Cyprinid herpesvirus 3]AOO32497.1 major capsid protein [Cyprinid herpesvirus 3]AOO32656.1 major capsid protein [Cyprinid herpesvirus 3]AOO32813.1 major capsid protein [Cyprinid herpesvirus 3]
MASQQFIIGRQPATMGTNFSTDDFGINRGSVTDGNRFKQLRSLNSPGVKDFMKKFNGWTGEKLINSYLDLGMEDMKYAWGADTNLNDFLRDGKAYAVALGRLMVGGSLTELQTKNYVGLSLMSRMLLPDGIPEDNAVFSLSIVYDQMTMALPGAIRSLAADVNAWQTTMSFGLTQYTTSIQFLHQELLYLVKSEPVTEHARRKFGQMMNRFRLSIIHSHAQAAVRQPGFVETIIGRQLGKSIIDAAGVVYNIAKAEALLCGLCTRNPATMTPLVEIALMALTSRGDLDNSNTHYFGAMNSQFFLPQLVTHTAVVSTVMPTFTYNTSRDRVEAAKRSEILSVAWESAVIAPPGSGPVQSASAGYTASLTVPAASIPMDSVTLPAVVVSGGAVVPFILFDGQPICRDGPSMGRPFVSNGLQYRYFTVGCPAPITSGLSPATLFDESVSNPISAAALSMYTPRKTCVFDEHGDTRFVDLATLHVKAEVAELWDINRARQRFNALPTEQRATTRVEAYLNRADVLWVAPTQKKLQSQDCPYEFSPRFMTSLALNNGNLQSIVKHRGVMWNQTAMSEPHIENIAVAAELYTALGLNDQQLKNTVAFIQSCGAAADARMMRDCVALKMLAHEGTSLDDLEQHHGNADPVVAILDFHEHRATPVANTPSARADSAYDVLSEVIPRLLNRLLGGTGHLLLSDPCGWHIFGRVLNFFENHIGERDATNNQRMSRYGFHMTHEHFSTLIKIRDTLAHFEAVVGKWLSPLHLPNDPYVFLGDNEPMTVRWSWIACAIFDTAVLFGTEVGYLKSRVVAGGGGNHFRLHHATCAGSLAFVGTNLPNVFEGMVAAGAPNRNIMQGAVAGIDVYSHSGATFLYQTGYVARSEAEHDSAVSCLGHARASRLRRSFNTCPLVALAMATHYSLVVNQKNVLNFDKFYYSGWSYLVVRRLEFEAGGFSVMPVQSHLLVVGNSKFDLAQEIGLDGQFCLRSMMRYAVVPLGVLGQGVYFPASFIRNVKGLGLEYVNHLQSKPRYSMNSFDHKSACMHAFIMDWAPSMHPPIQGAATGVGPILSANGRFNPLLGNVSAADFFKPDAFNVQRFYTTCPFQNPYLNEMQAALHRILGQLGDPNADMFAPGKRNAVLTTTIKHYYQFLTENTSVMSRLEKNLQTRLQTMGEEYFASHGFNKSASVFYVDNSTIGAQSEQLLKTPIDSDNRGTFLIMCRTDNITFDPKTTDVPINKLLLDLQGLNPLRLLEVNPTNRANLTRQILNNDPAHAV